jgi:hypothetical protein
MHVTSQRNKHVVVKLVQNECYCIEMAGFLTRRLPHTWKYVALPLELESPPANFDDIPQRIVILLED